MICQPQVDNARRCAVHGLPLYPDGACAEREEDEITLESIRPVLAVEPDPFPSERPPVLPNPEDL